jgi:hypothetical protein
MQKVRSHGDCFLISLFYFINLIKIGIPYLHTLRKENDNLIEIIGNKRDFIYSRLIADRVNKCMQR